jgi:cytochrome b561
VLIIANLASGLLHDAVERQVALIPFHKATGLTILVLSLLRLAWRFSWRPPPWPESLGRATLLVARATHAAFYVLMIVMPVTGWIMSSASERPLVWYGLFPVYKLPVAKGSALAGFGHEAHELLGWLFLALVVLHVAAALRHQFVLRDEVLRRMW